MIPFGTLPPTIVAGLDAGLLIGAVLLEAIALYVVYGVLEQALGQSVLERIRKI